MALPAIPLPNPRTQPAVPEKVYDRVFIESVQTVISHLDPNGEATAIVRWWPARLDDNGQWELDPTVTEARTMLRENLLRRVGEGDMQLAQVMGATMQYVARMAREDLTPPPTPVEPTPVESRPAIEDKPVKKSTLRKKGKAARAKK